MTDKVRQKGPALKIGKDHKLVKYLEKAIGKDGESPYACYPKYYE